MLERASRIIRSKNDDEKRGWFDRLRTFVLDLIGHKENFTVSQPVIVMSIGYDGFGRPTRVAKREGTWVEVRYDNFGRVVEQRDQDGNTVEFELSSEGGLLAWSVQSGGQVAQARRRHTYAYSPMSRIIDLAVNGGKRINLEQESVVGAPSVKHSPQVARETYRWDETGRSAAQAVKTYRNIQRRQAQCPR